MSVHFLELSQLQDKDLQTLKELLGFEGDICTWCKRTYDRVNAGDVGSGKCLHVKEESEKEIEDREDTVKRGIDALGNMPDDVPRASLFFMAAHGFLAQRKHDRLVNRPKPKERHIQDVEADRDLVRQHPEWLVEQHKKRLAGSAERASKGLKLLQKDLGLLLKHREDLAFEENEPDFLLPDLARWLEDCNLVGLLSERVLGLLSALGEKAQTEYDELRSGLLQPLRWQGKNLVSSGMDFRLGEPKRKETAAGVTLAADGIKELLKRHRHRGEPLGEAKRLLGAWGIRYVEDATIRGGRPKREKGDL